MKKIISISLIICMFILCSCSESNNNSINIRESNNNSINISKKTAYDSNGMPYDSITVIGPGKSISNNLVINRDANDGKIDRIEDRAFLQCNKITSVKISGDINIGKNAFSECANLKSVAIKGCEIGDNAFYNCDSLESITLEGYCEINESAFYDCDKLKSVTLDSGTVNRSAFYSCDNLESVTFTDTFCTIYPDSFLGCNKHITINFPGTRNAFESCIFEFRFNGGLSSLDGGITVKCTDGSLYY